MDPDVGVNVVHARDLRNAEDPEAERRRLAQAWSRDQDPFGAAGIMALDEIIDPADTRRILVEAVRRHPIIPAPRDRPRPLAYWPTCY
jgi:acetyl-CoA carboxylase carboxyltransferase component